jgi:hypothetical protein
MDSRSISRAVVALLISGFLLANLLGALRIASPLNNKDVSKGWQPKLKPKPTKYGSPPRYNATRRTSDRRIFLVHVGKTGGETVRHTLKITCKLRKNPVHQQACWDTFSKANESSLSQHTIGTMHCDVVLPNKGLERATTLVWTLRNPVERVVSWFRYMNPANCRPVEDYYSTACNTNRSIINNKSKGSKWTVKFFTCFQTINHFADALHTGIMDTTASNCSQLAWRTIQGEGSASSGHIHFNHKFYWQETIAKYPRAEVWVVRTEYLWEDMDQIERLLGNESVTTSHTAGKRNVTHGSEGHVHKDSLSPQGIKTLCCALKEEVAIYGNLLGRATNLAAHARYQSLWMAANQCGADSWETFNASVCTET